MRPEATRRNLAELVEVDLGDIGLLSPAEGLARVAGKNVVGEELGEDGGVVARGRGIELEDRGHEGGVELELRR